MNRLFMMTIAVLFMSAVVGCSHFNKSTNVKNIKDTKRSVANVDDNPNLAAAIEASIDYRSKRSAHSMKTFLRGSYLERILVVTKRQQEPYIKQIYFNFSQDVIDALNRNGYAPVKLPRDGTPYCKFESPIDLQLAKTDGTELVFFWLVTRGLGSTSYVYAYDLYSVDPAGNQMNTYINFGGAPLFSLKESEPLNINIQCN